MNPFEQLTLDALWNQVKERLGDDAEDLIARAGEQRESRTPMTTQDYENFDYSKIPADEV